MFSSNLLSTAFSIPIFESIQHWAEIESLKYLPCIQKARQVYLFCLSQYVTYYYLRLCGYLVTNLTNCAQNFVAQALTDSAVVIDRVVSDL